MSSHLLRVAWLVVMLPCIANAATDDRWFPVQAVPAGLVRTAPESQRPAGDKYALRMLLQSISGLAAQAVNEHRGDELLWVTSTNVNVEEWGKRFLADHPQVADRGTFSPWDLVDRYARQRLIKGYILYRKDTSKQVPKKPYRADMNTSANVATSMAGLLGGVMIDESLEPKAKQHGLALLLDARDKTQKWCFETYRDKFNRHALCTQDPEKIEVRDLVIAHRIFATYGPDEPFQEAMAWIEPPAPVLGWNGGDEFKTTNVSSINGDFQTSTDWCQNLPVLSAGSENATLPKAPAFDPRGIDWSDKRSTVSFLESDGDNAQWFETGFFRGKGYYWDNPQRGQIPFGWSCPFAHLAQICPQAISYAEETRKPNDWFIEWGGGYYYPDLFASARPDRWDIVAKQAARTWSLMQKTGTHSIGFNVRWIGTADALRAYRTFARQTDGLTAIFAFEYSPYNAGQGEVFWVKDKNGVEIPVITLRYMLWYHHNDKPLAGTPARVARLIRQSVAKTAPADLPRNDWLMAHAWSYFKQAPGTDENAEDTKEGDTPPTGAIRGYTPVLWCADRLPSNVHLVAPEEMAWRIRMQHNPAQTKEVLAKWQP